jgi:hypothetical protein
LSFLRSSSFFDNLDRPTFIEWIMAPNTLPGY